MRYSIENLAQFFGSLPLDMMLHTVSMKCHFQKMFAFSVSDVLSGLLSSILLTDLAGVLAT
jgi:hypothetical protein